MLLISNGSADAHESTQQHADPVSHAPIGVMGDHMHKKGEWMTSYRYMRMDMDQIYTGSKEISPSNVHSAYMISPSTMKMHMHMVGVMYGMSDEITLMGMIPYHFKSMDHIQRTDGQMFTSRTEGIGDIKLTGMFSLKRLTEQNIQFNLGVSFPTGSIGERGTTLIGVDQKFPYPMQLGSGTVDVLPALTYYDATDNWNWGAQLRSTIRNGRNQYKYTLGNEYGLTSWVAYKWLDWLSTSLRVGASKRGHIRGRDHQINAAMVPTADANNWAHERVDVLLGTNIVVPDGPLKDHRFALEVGQPVYIHAEGPQLMSELVVTFGWQKQF